RRPASPTSTGGALGNPPAIRELYLAGDAELGHKRFREYLQNGASVALDELAESLGEETVALLCLERDLYRRHRSLVASVAAERLPGDRPSFTSSLEAVRTPRAA
ncbi:MAG: DUF488 family protein, partial [Actinobacteria bacterium]|nr:DUF488 family protein [Actinomycetota bacterium]